MSTNGLEDLNAHTTSPQRWLRDVTIFREEPEETSEEDTSAQAGGGQP